MAFLPCLEEACPCSSESAPSPSSIDGLSLGCLGTKSQSASLRVDAHEPQMEESSSSTLAGTPIDLISEPCTPMDLPQEH
mmetsp:Transcript_88520/g.166944  ORF Transcript_88520/g.166944 Transcript_88520/m.166944 type:complete len:80 (-) Transcript_88520:30-269(-)